MINDQIKAIKSELRLAMNGVASTRMRESGIIYKVNFGVELPRLQQIAAEQPHTRELAQALWQEPVRECKIMAAMLMPTEEFDRAMAYLWTEEMPNIEIARLTTMYLFSRLPEAITLAFEWMASENEIRQTCGFLIIARLLMQGIELNERSLAEVRDQAEATIASKGIAAQAAAAALTRIQ